MAKANLTALPFAIGTGVLGHPGTASRDRTLDMVSTGVAALPGGVPTCVADLKIRPDSKYPAWNQASLHVTVSFLDLPDHSSVGVNYTQTGSSQLFCCPAISLLGGTGSRNIRFLLSPGSTLTRVTITDPAGRTLFNGN